MDELLLISYTLGLTLTTYYTCQLCLKDPVMGICLMLLWIMQHTNDC